MLEQLEQLQTMHGYSSIAVSGELKKLSVQNEHASQSSLLQNRTSPCLLRQAGLVGGIVDSNPDDWTLKTRKMSGDSGQSEPEQELWQGGMH